MLTVFSGSFSKHDLGLVVGGHWKMRLLRNHRFIYTGGGNSGNYLLNASAL